MGRRSDARKEHDARRRERAPWRKLYFTRRWKRKRADQLAAHPLCRYCLLEGRSRVATVVNHVTPHRGDPELFWSSPLESTCKECHDARVQRAEIRGYDATPGADGWPADPNHPFNRRSDRNDP